MRRLSRRERAPFHRIRHLLPKSPQNLSPTEQDRILRLVRCPRPLPERNCSNSSGSTTTAGQARTQITKWIRKAKRAPGTLQGFRAIAGRPGGAPDLVTGLN
jgi:hypothetical protein